MKPAPVATGTITLDRDKAKEKLRRFQLADPCTWLLELVRAAIAQGASAITMLTDADDVRVSFDGAGFTVADVEHLYQALLARRAPPARQHLAVALNGALALGPRFVELTSKGAQGSVRARLVPGRPDEFGPVDDDAPAGTTVWLRHPFRVGAFVEFFRARFGTQREIAAVRHACRFLETPVTVNGRALTSSRPTKRGRVVRCAGASDGLVFEVEVADARCSGRLVFTYRGLVLEEPSHPLLPAGVCALLSADHLARDASLSACLRDEAWSTLVDAALVQALELCERQGGVLLAQAALRLGPVVLDPAKSDELLGHAPQLRAALAKETRPLFRQQVLSAVDDTPLTLALIAKVLRAGRALPTSTRRCRVGRTGDPVALVEDGDARALLTHFVGDRHQPGEELLADAERRDSGRRRLHQRREQIALPPGLVLGRARAAGGTARAIVALRPNGTRLRLALYTDGCLIGVHDVDCPLPGISMALEAAFTLDADGTDVVRDGVFARALRTGFAALPDALADACANAQDREALAARALPLLAWSIDADAIWSKLAAGLALPKLDDLAALPELVLDGKARHPVTRLACVPRIDGSHASLDELRGKAVPVVPVGTERFSRPDAVRAGDVLRAVLARVAEVEPQDELAAREQRRAVLLRRPATLRAPYPPLAELAVGDDVKGWVCFGNHKSGIMLEAHIAGRALPTFLLDDARLTPLRIVVDDPHLLPLANGNLATTDAKRLVRVGLAAAGALLETAAGSPGASSRGRQLALALLTALAPTLPLARASQALAAPEYLALRALSLAGDVNEVDPLIELALEAGLPPTLEHIRELAKAAGTKLPKRGATDQEPRALVLAPLGGLRALRGFDDDVPLRTRVLQRVPALPALELRTFDGVVTVQALLADGAPTRFVAAGFLLPDGMAPDGRVLRLTSEEHDALRALLGPATLVDASAALREQVARRRHEAKPVEPATLRAALHPTVVPLELDGARGELGLLPPQATEPSAHLRVLSGSRFVKRVDLGGAAPCSFAAVIDDPMLPLELDGPEGGSRVAVLAALCLASADRAIDALAASLNAERPDARARACLLERLANRDQRRPIEVERLGRLSSAPLVDTVDGRWASLDQLAAEALRHGSLACVAVAPRGAPPRALVLVVPVAFHRALLAAAARTTIEDIAAAWQRDAGRRAALQHFPPLPTPPSDALEVAEASVAGVRVALWVTAETRGAQLAGGLEGRQVGVVDINTVLPAVDGTAVGEAVLDPTFSFVTLARAWPAIDVAATALATRLVDERLRDDAPAAVNDWCRRLTLSLAASPDAHGKRLGPLLTRLRARPLFLAPDGGRLSLDQVLAMRPEAFEDELVAHGLVRPPDPAPATLPTPRVPTPEEALFARLGELLGMLSLDGPTEAELARWPLLVVRRKGATLVRFTRTHCEVDVEHELGRAALDGDHAALDLVCAVVVGAANHHLDEIDAHHERGFLARLLAHAATRGG